MQIKCLFCSLILGIMLCAPQGSYSKAEVISSPNECESIDNVEGNNLWNQDYSNFKNAKFHHVCGDGTWAIQGKNYCVSFNDISVLSMNHAVHIAKLYAKERNGDDIACYPRYKQCKKRDWQNNPLIKRNEDHILCANADDSVHYEFAFKYITEKSEDVYKKGVSTAICRTFMGDDAKAYSKKDAIYGLEYDTPDAEAMVCSFTADKNSTKAKVARLKQAVENSFGYTVVWYEDAPSSFAINFSRYDICHAKNVDRFFASQKMYYTLDVVALLAGYASRNISKNFKTFRCDLAPSTCHIDDDKFSETKDFLRCYVDDDPYVFEFSKLNSTNKKFNAGATAALQCMNEENGVFDGSRCQGVTPEQCDDLKQITKTHWDTDIDACVLDESEIAKQSQEQIDSYVAFGGLIASMVLMTFAGPGGEVLGGRAVRKNIIFIGAKAENVYGRMFADAFAAKKFAQNTAELAKCNTGQCVKENVASYLTDFVRYKKDVTDTEVLAFDKILADKLGLLADADAQGLLRAIQGTNEQTVIDLYRSNKLKTYDVARASINTIDVLFAISSLKGGIGDLKSIKAFDFLPNISQFLVNFLNTINASFDFYQGTQSVSRAKQYTKVSLGNRSNSNTKTNKSQKGASSSW